MPSSARGAFYHAFFGEWGAFRSGLPCGERRTRRARRPAVMAAGRERAVPSKVLFYPFEATRSVLSCLFRQGERSIMPFLASGGLRSGLPCVCAEGRAPPCRRLHVGVHCGRPCGCVCQVCAKCVPAHPGRGAGVLARGRGQESILLQRDFRRFLRGARDRNGLPKLGTRAGQGRSERKARVYRFGQLTCD